MLAPDPFWLIGRGCAVVAGVSAGICRDKDTVVPVFTSAAARRRASGVIRFRAPRSSSLPHRPQFDSFVIHSSNCALVTLPVLAAPDPEGCADCAVCPTTTETPNSEAAAATLARTSRGRRRCLRGPEAEEIRSSMESDSDMKGRPRTTNCFPAFVTECALSHLIQESPCVYCG